MRINVNYNKYVPNNPQKYENIEKIFEKPEKSDVFVTHVTKLLRTAAQKQFNFLY
jgi:hypothetical protein